jgi:hypothetical protein
MRESVFQRIDAAVARGVCPVVVFDLDSTLFDTAGRHLQILTEYAQACQAEHPDLLACVRDLSHGDFGWNIRAPLEARGYRNEEALAGLNSFWFERFFTHAYVLHDLPTLGAVSFAREVHERGALVYYLTGRDVPGMGTGTASALMNAGFPLWRGRCVLHLKPRFDMKDKPFKEAAMEDIRSHGGEVVATFENEPGNANAFLAAFEDAEHFLVGSVHSPNAEAADPRLKVVADFS